MLNYQRVHVAGSLNPKKRWTTTTISGEKKHGPSGKSWPIHQQPGLGWPFGVYPWSFPQDDHRNDIRPFSVFKHGWDLMNLPIENDDFPWDFNGTLW